MPNTTFLSLAGAKVIAAERVTALENAVLHEFKSGALVPTVTTTLEQLSAIEANYDGYAPITIATWDGPYLAPGTGWEVLGGQVVFVWTYSSGVGNSIGGTYLVDAAGNLLDITVYQTAVPMTGVGCVDICNPFEVIVAG